MHLAALRVGDSHAAGSRTPCRRRASRRGTDPHHRASRPRDWLACRPFQVGEIVVPGPPASALDTEVWRPQRLQVLTLQVRARQIDVLRRPHQLHLPELRRRSVSPRIACFIRTSIAVRFGTVFAAVKFCSEPGRTKREARCAPALRTNHGRIKYRWRSERKRDERPDRDRGDARKHQHEHVPALRHVWDHARFSRTAQPTCSGFGPRVRS